MDGTTIALGVSFLLAILSSVFGVKWNKSKAVAENVVEIAEKIIDVIKDDNISEQEVKEIAEKGKDLINKEKAKIKKQ